MGYQPDPVLAATMRGLKNRDHQEIRGNLGLLVASGTPSEQELSEHLILEGLRQSATESRFALEQLALSHCDHMDGEQLLKIFRARGCQGLVVVERQRTLESVSCHQITLNDVVRELPTIAVGRTAPDHDVGSISVDWMHAVTLALRGILAAGYQRPGLMISDTRLYASALAGFLGARETLVPPLNHVPPLRHYLRVTTLDAIRQWIAQWNVDCLLSHESLLRRYSTALQEQLAIVSFDIAGDTHSHPGISVPWHKLGENAIDELVSRILFSKAPGPGQILVRGEWHPDRELPPPERFKPKTEHPGSGYFPLTLPSTRLTPLNSRKHWISKLGPPPVPEQLHSAGVPFQLTELPGAGPGVFCFPPFPRGAEDYTATHSLSIVLPSGCIALHILHACSHAAARTLVGEFTVSYPDDQSLSQPVTALGIPHPGAHLREEPTNAPLIQDWWPSYPLLGSTTVHPIHISATPANPYAGVLYHFHWRLPQRKSSPRRLELRIPQNSQSGYALFAITSETAHTKSVGTVLNNPEARRKSQNPNCQDRSAPPAGKTSSAPPETITRG